MKQSWSIFINYPDIHLNGMRKAINEYKPAAVPATQQFISNTIQPVENTVMHELTLHYQLLLKVVLSAFLRKYKASP